MTFVVASTLRIRAWRSGIRIGVGDIEISDGVKCDSPRNDVRRGRRSVIAEPIGRRSSTGVRADLASGVDAPDYVVQRIGDVQISGRVKRQVLRKSDGGLRRI